MLSFLRQLPSLQRGRGVFFRLRPLAEELPGRPVVNVGPFLADNPEAERLESFEDVRPDQFLELFFKEDPDLARKSGVAVIGTSGTKMSSSAPDMDATAEPFFGRGRTAILPLT